MFLLSYGWHDAFRGIFVCNKTEAQIHLRYLGSTEAENKMGFE